MDINKYLSIIQDCKNLSDLEKVRIPLFGKNGEITKMVQDLKTLSAEEKKTRGKEVNEIKKRLEQAIEDATKRTWYIKSVVATSDHTIPGFKPHIGHLHPLTLVINEIVDIFRYLGFSVADGPEIETDEYNFQKLLLDKDHPSRDTQETYYFDEKRLLRVHTSSVQVRYMETHKPPIRIIVPGRVYRRDQIDAWHLPSFYQIEGLMVDDKTTLTDLMGVLEFMVKKMFGENRKVKFYGHHFPYTEPSLEAAMLNEKGEWKEILGCGMVHPQVLRNCNIDPEKYQGWAFGMGSDRIAMLKYGISDIRLLHSNDLRFLKQ